MKIKIMKSRRFLTILTICLASALLLTGTYAWQQTVQKTNEFIGTGGGVLHDDFNPKTGEKDIYVENISDKPIYVRLKLTEAMNLSDSSWRPGALDEFVHIFEASDADCGHSNLDSEKFHDYFHWIMGGQKYYMPAKKGPTAADITVYDGSENGVRVTPYAFIITMSDYLAMQQVDRENFLGWIYDTDGFAYWSQPLEADGGVTGLLLHWVNTDPNLDGSNYYYSINVQGEIVDSEDLDMWIDHASSADKSGMQYDEASPDAKILLNKFKDLAE